MNEKLDKQEIEHRFELLKKDYQIMEANIDGTLKTMRADIDGTLKDMRTDIERNNTEFGNKIHAQTKWIVGIVLGVVVLIIAMAGLFLQVLITTS